MARKPASDARPGATALRSAARLVLPLAVVALLASAYTSPGVPAEQAQALVTTAAPPLVATTAPVGIRLVPSPTPLRVPVDVAPVEVGGAPTATPLAEPAPAVHVELVSDAATDAPAAGPSATPHTEVTPSPEPVAAEPVTTEPDTQSEASTAPPDQPEPSALPAPTPTVDPTVVPAATPMADAAMPAPSAPTAVPMPETDQASEELGLGGPAEPVPVKARTITTTRFEPLGVVGGITVLYPVGHIELIGFHEAGHPGSLEIEPVDSAVPSLTMASRLRGTNSQSAADIVVPPGEPVLSPVSGTVVASKQYVLYCKYDDRLVYIEPDGQPGWQVKLFHLEGEGPPVGSRVEAGVTRVGTGARALPFESQVDVHSADPSWPHVHLEVVDTTVPDTRPPGPGC